jgi:hypothetical protein
VPCSPGSPPGVGGSPTPSLTSCPTASPLRHLRSVLVASGALPARDEYLIQLERWIHQAVAARPDAGQKQLLHSYAVWHVLRRLRQRLRGIPATHNQAYTAQHHVTAAIAFLDWLAGRSLTLATCAQGDLDAWMATASTDRKGTTGHFVRWPGAASTPTWTSPAPAGVLARCPRRHRSKSHTGAQESEAVAGRVKVMNSRSIRYGESVKLTEQVQAGDIHTTAVRRTGPQAGRVGPDGDAG